VDDYGTITATRLTFFKCTGEEQLYSDRWKTNDGAKSSETVKVTFSNCYNNDPDYASLAVTYDGFYVSDCVFNQKSGTYFYVHDTSWSSWVFTV
jgi:hypothetical protein